MWRVLSKWKQVVEKPVGKGFVAVVGREVEDLQARQEAAVRTDERLKGMIVQENCWAALRSSVSDAGGS